LLKERIKVIYTVEVLKLIHTLAKGATSGLTATPIQVNLKQDKSMALEHGSNKVKFMQDTSFKTTDMGTG